MLTTLPVGARYWQWQRSSAAPVTGWLVTPIGRIHTAHLVSEGNKRTFDLCSHLMMNSNNQVSKGNDHHAAITVGWAKQASWSGVRATKKRATPLFDSVTLFRCAMA